jgi:hypothetical protein
MKIIISLAVIVIIAIGANAQAKPIAAGDHSKAFRYAVSETNKAFPFIFTVVTDTYEDGKVVSSETDVNERQAPGVERETKTLVEGGKTRRSYSIMIGFGNNTYCSKDGITWSVPQQYVCPGPNESGLLWLDGPRTPETVEYSVTDSTREGEAVKIYREYSVFGSSDPKGEKDFRDTIATIDSRGFFILVVNIEGTLDPRTVTVTLIRKQTWDLKTKFKPVVAPK